jgi:hypothetical protein
MRVVLNHKLILAENLTADQASSLIKQMRERDKTKAIFNDTIYMESAGPLSWCVTVLMPHAKDFIEDSHAFIFEV